mgnify:CR=1 FL=1
MLKIKSCYEESQRKTSQEKHFKKITKEINLHKKVFNINDKDYFGILNSIRKNIETVAECISKNPIYCNHT